MKYRINIFLFIIFIFNGAASASNWRSFYENVVDTCAKQEPESFVSETRSFYDDLVQGAAEKKWLVTSSLNFSVAENGFDDKNNHVNLTEFLFGDPFRVRDIFLISRLSADRKLFTGAGTQAESEGQFLSYLAPLNVSLCAVNIHEFTWNISGVYRSVACNGTSWTVGLHVPIKTKSHEMDLNFTGDNVFAPGDGFVPTVREFFDQHFTSLEDFMLGGVFELKGLTFKRNQRKTGFGDVHLFALVDVAHYFCKLTSFEFGTSLVLPTATKPKEEKIWEPLLGNSAFQFGFFSNMIFDSSSSLAHPTLRFGAELSASYCGKRRIQSIVSLDNGVSAAALLGAVETGFNLHTVRGPISETDSTTPLLADIAFDANISLGSRIFFGIGNYFYNVFGRPFRMGVFWDIDMKRADKVSVSDKQGRTFTTELLEARTVQRAHRFSWDLHYRSDSGIEAGVGSAHVVLGRNVPKTHEFFLTFVALF